MNTPVIKFKIRVVCLVPLVMFKCFKFQSQFGNFQTDDHGTNT